MMTPHERDNVIGMPRNLDIRWMQAFELQLGIFRLNRQCNFRLIVHNDKYLHTLIR